MTVSVRLDDAATLRIRGPLTDAVAAALGDAVAGVLEGGATSLDLDLSEVTSIDEGGVAMLEQLRRRLIVPNVRFRLLLPPAGTQIDPARIAEGIGREGWDSANHGDALQSADPGV